MSLEEKAKAVTKNVEGKVQQAVGKLAEDPQMQAKGEAKQVEAETLQTKEDVKDKAKDIID